MPLFSKRKSHGTDFKARLEHKLYLARENPEPVFDISDCDLKNVPSGIFSLCKVFRKDSLYLQENHLSSLNGGGNMKDLAFLQVLDLSSNLLTSLPDDIRFLANLRVLNVRKNNLKQLTDAIGDLVKLQTLDVSNNCLKNITSALGNLRQLRQLDLRENAQLTSLPAALCQATSLTEIQVEGTSLVHPPQLVVSQGTDAILQFLAEESGLDCTTLREAAKASEPMVDSGDNRVESANFYAKIMQLERLKEIKQRGMLALEQDMEEHHKREFELQDAMKQSRVRLLDDLMEHQCRLESDILRVHRDHETERERLVRDLLAEERSADVVVSRLLALRGGAAQDPSMQREHLEEEELLNVRHREYESLRRRDVLGAMEAMLEEEYRREEKLREYEEGRAVATRTLLSQEVDDDRQLAGLLSSQGRTQQELIGRIQRDEELQRAAVGALLERGDARSWGLVQQVCLVEQQLAALTAVEMRRRSLQLSDQVSDLCEKRVALSELLVELLAQQTERRRHLLHTMAEMDRKRWEGVGDRAEGEGDRDFWLRQYHRLLDSRPGEIAEMERCMDPLLAQHLVLAGAAHCLPCLGRWLADATRCPTDAELGEAGLSLATDREAVREAIGRYLEEAKLRQVDLAQVEPSAPGPQALPASAPEAVIGAAECVVCMELQCEVIFVPCGHMCCCIKCAEVLATCPMCRAEVQQKIRAIMP